MVGKCGGLRFFRSKTVTHIVGKCGGLTSYPRKTLTTVEGNSGGGGLRELKTVNHDGVWYGSVAPHACTNIKELFFMALYIAMLR